MRNCCIYLWIDRFVSCRMRCPQAAYALDCSNHCVKLQVAERKLQKKNMKIEVQRDTIEVREQELREVREVVETLKRMHRPWEKLVWCLRGSAEPSISFLILYLQCLPFWSDSPVLIKIHTRLIFLHDFCQSVTANVGSFLKYFVLASTGLGHWAKKLFHLLD